MSHHLAAAVDTAARYQIAAPAPAMEIAGGTLGAILAGLGIMVWVIARWKQSSKEARVHFILGCLSIAMLSTAGGLIGDLIGAAQNTGGQLGTTITQTGVGR